LQKKIIALAVAGLMSGAAFAQSNVTISGLVDMGFSHRSDNLVSGVANRSGFDGGQQSGSRIQFAGSEDLGGGMKAVFLLETGINVDRGGLSANGSTGGNFGRQTYMGLAGGFGTFVMGRVYTPQFNLVTAVDPFGTGLVGQVNNVYTMAASPLAAAQQGGGAVRLDNVAAYISPSFSGLTVVGAYTRNGVANESNNNADVRVWAIAPTYSNGPLMVGLNYHNIKADVLSFSTKTWDLGATYDLGVVKLAALFGKDSDINAAKDDARKYMLGVTAPLGNGALLASYTRSRIDHGSAADYKGRQWAIGYQYNLSKRTNAYVAYSDINNDNGAQFGVGDSSNAGTDGAATHPYQKGINVGLRHKF